MSPFICFSTWVCGFFRNFRLFMFSLFKFSKDDTLIVSLHLDRQFSAHSLYGKLEQGEQLIWLILMKLLQSRQKMEEAYQLLQDIMPDYFSAPLPKELVKSCRCSAILICIQDPPRRVQWRSHLRLPAQRHQQSRSHQPHDGRASTCLMPPSISQKNLPGWRSEATLIIEHYTEPRRTCQTRFTLEDVQKEYARQFGSGQEKAHC